MQFSIPCQRLVLSFSRPKQSKNCHTDWENIVIKCSPKPWVYSDWIPILSSNTVTKARIITLLLPNWSPSIFLYFLPKGYHFWMMFGGSTEHQSRSLPGPRLTKKWPNKPRYNGQWSLRDFHHLLDSRHLWSLFVKDGRIPKYDTPVCLQSAKSKPCR